MGGLLEQVFKLLGSSRKLAGVIVLAVPLFLPVGKAMELVELNGATKLDAIWLTGIRLVVSLAGALLVLEACAATEAAFKRYRKKNKRIELAKLLGAMRPLSKIHPSFAQERSNKAVLSARQSTLLGCLS